ncbi:hypothetical protein [Massilia rubra]|uniref:Uncharacterized protein n=1 Tax=Massilia rubra TaxID=2607910 RepID=A0ABX0M2A7_9BURK|nr:hypothetical protein [Massilia rubra]NHZ38347.1 hypothetical protein [Massilia rubra]
MKQHHWHDLIVRSVQAKDERTIDSLARHLAECETAKQILQAKGYGTQGQGIEATARLVPHSRD